MAQLRIHSATACRAPMPWVIGVQALDALQQLHGSKSSRSSATTQAMHEAAQGVAGVRCWLLPWRSPV